MSRPRFVALACLAILLLSAGCNDADAPTGGPGYPSEVERQDAATIGPDTLSTRADAVMAQTVYVPVYSHIFFQDDRRQIDLTATLSVRNTDPTHPVTVTAVGYYDSDGRLVRRYLDRPVTLGPLASRPYVVEERNLTGGVGANFLVEWEAGVRVSLPIAEAVMISTAGSQGISFISRGQTVRSLDDRDIVQ